MAAMARRRKTEDTQEGRSVKVSCSLDVATHARLCAAASLRGVSISTYIEDAVKEALKGIVVIDRRKGDNQPEANPSMEQVSAVKASPV